tara:strand:+ start:1463 stop:1699 length:237 start_codon:yes stop_codon:yes gene_type:complete
MGFDKRHISKERILSSFRNYGAKGVTDLYVADAVFMPADSNICNYIEKINNMSVTIEHKHKLIETYMLQLLEGLYKYK